MGPVRIRALKRDRFAAMRRIFDRPMPRLRSITAAAALAGLLLGGTASADDCPPQATGDCLAAHSGGGCDDPDCCGTVCAINPVCCQEIWDSSCAEIADTSCVGLCGASASLSCFVPHPTPSCDDPACCAAVCTLDPVCCATLWDSQCVLQAQFMCDAPQPVECGLAGQGSCTSLHASPGCSDGQCCQAVCDLVPNCCIFSWDQVCVDIARSACGYCSLVCPTGGMQEAEACGARSNEACVGTQSAANLTLGQTLCGFLSKGSAAIDRDTFQFTLVDGDGDGKVRLLMRFAAEGPAFAALVPATCPINVSASGMYVNSSGCAAYEAAQCLPPGTYRVFVSMGTFPSPATDSTIDCVNPRRYQLTCIASDAGCDPVCGANSGPCFDAHLGPGCSDPDCCEPAWDTCCTSAWDNFCVSLAYSLCTTGCDPGCPANSQQETETCGSRTNDPVFRPGSPAGTPQTIQRNRDLCGRLTVTSTLQDVDVYVVNLAGLDTDQDGVVKMRVLLSSASPMFAAVVPVGSTAQVLPSGSLLTVDASGCGTSKGWTCVAPTFWWVVVARGSGGLISGTDTGCESGKYLLRVETDAVCGNPCGSGAGNCFAPHASAGCADAACCAQTCAMIPDCCDIGWDSGCAVAADDLCGAPAPANDACDQASRVTEGSWPLTLFGATVDGGAFTAGCSISTAASSRDVWFRWNPSRSGECQIDLCGAEWDTRLEVFEGSCGSASIRACADDSPFCTPSRASRLTFQASCGRDYLIRVSGPSTERGVATLRISTPAGPSCCVGDLDLSGSVDAGDIGALLLRFT